MVLRTDEVAAARRAAGRPKTYLSFVPQKKKKTLMKKFTNPETVQSTATCHKQKRHHF